MYERAAITAPSILGQWRKIEADESHDLATRLIAAVQGLGVIGAQDTRDVPQEPMLANSRESPDPSPQTQG